MYYTLQAITAIVYQCKRTLFQRRIRKTGMTLYKQMSKDKVHSDKEMSEIMCDIEKCQKAISELVSHRTLHSQQQ